MHQLFYSFNYFILSIFLLLFSSNINSKNLNYTTEVVMTGINVPWGMVQLPNNQLLISERSGKLYLANLRTGKKSEVKGLPEIESGGQGGLLDVELHPDYKNNGWIYFSYTSPEGQGKGNNTAIMRAKLKNLTLTKQKVIYKASPNSTRTHHYGSRIEFDKNGYLYFSIGDRGDRDINPQNIHLDGGKIYRLHDDGRIPFDNPFIKNVKAKAAIYSFGHRNPQGMALNPVSGDIWIHEHGPKGGDEINIVQKGKNYGWPVISYGTNYDGTQLTDITQKEGMEQPVWYWTPSIAPSGMTFITSDKYPEWQGSLLVGSLKFGYLVLCRLEGNQVISQKILFKGIGRVRHVKQMSDGYVYVATDNNKIVKINALK